MNFLML